MSLIGEIKQEIELRGFAPIGMLECWNSGILGERKKRNKAHTIALFLSL
jgi:hypothetical protein